MALAPALGWHLVLGEAIISIAVAKPARVPAAVDTRSAEVLDAAFCDHFHGRHGPKREPFGHKK